MTDERTEHELTFAVDGEPIHLRLGLASADCPPVVEAGGFDVRLELPEGRSASSRDAAGFGKPELKVKATVARTARGEPVPDGLARFVVKTPDLGRDYRYTFVATSAQDRRFGDAPGGGEIELLLGLGPVVPPVAAAAEEAPGQPQGGEPPTGRRRVPVGSAATEGGD